MPDKDFKHWTLHIQNTKFDYEVKDLPIMKAFFKFVFTLVTAKLALEAPAIATRLQKVVQLLF